MKFRLAIVRAGQFRQRSLTVTTSGNSSGQPDAGREKNNLVWALTKMENLRPVLRSERT